MPSIFFLNDTWKCKKFYVLIRTHWSIHHNKRGHYDKDHDVDGYAIDHRFFHKKDSDP